MDEEAYTGLRALLQLSLDFANQVLEERINASATNFSQQVGAMLFLTQADHAEAVFRLGNHRDAALIARSMFEGQCTCRWLDNMPDEREDRCKAWLANSWVLDWNYFLERKKKDITSVTLDEENEIKAGLDQFGPLVMTKAAQEALKAGKPLPDSPYNLRPVPDIFSICRDHLQAPALYETYARLSEWAHFRLSGLALTWITTPGKRSYQPVDYGWSCWCLTICICGLLDATTFLDDAFGARRTAQISALYDQLLAIRRND